MKWSPVLSATIVIGSLVISYFTGFFNLPKNAKRNPVSWFHIVIAFLSYFFGMCATFIFNFFLPHHYLTDGLSLCLLSFFPLFLLFSYYRTLPGGLQRSIFWNLPTKPRLKFLSSIQHTIIGSSWCFFILLAFVSFLSPLLQKTIEFFYKNANFQEQHAIKIFKKASHSFALPEAWLLLVTIGIVTPFTEELLFRGFLQSWLSRYGRIFAIIMTSLIFAGLHFSNEQAAGNFIILPLLFTISLFIGFVYEKERNLIAPYLTHALFNLSQAVMMSI